MQKEAEVRIKVVSEGKNPGFLQAYSFLQIINSKTSIDLC